MPIKTLIVDDEFLARERLKKLLNSFVGILVIGECKNGEEAVSMIQHKAPDLVFLDVEMPGRTGLEVIQQLRVIGVALPLIVFTTAYDQYAVKAFESHAIDYLLKPFEKDRFQITVDRIEQQFQLQQAQELNQRMQRLIQHFSPVSATFRTAFTVSERGIERTLPVQEVYYLESDGNYLKLVTLERHWLYRGSLSQMEQELNPRDFLRIHRSTVIQVSCMDSYRYLGNNEYRFRMKNGATVLSGRTYKQSIQEYFMLES